MNAPFPPPLPDSAAAPVGPPRIPDPWRPHSTQSNVNWGGPPPPQRTTLAPVVPAAPPIRPRRWPTVALIAAVVAAGVSGVFVGARLNDSSSPRATPSTVVTVPTAVAPTRSDGRIDVAAVSKAIAESIVTVSTDVSDNGLSGEGVGTGVILSADGEILTNAHVVDGAEEVRVRLPHEREPRPAEVLATDAGNDLALLKVDASDLIPATFAQPTEAAVGDDVIAVGYALDLDGEASVTAGIVSGLDRTMLTAEGALDGLIQTDAAISSGNSGGPLVNSAAHVVGIITLVALGDANNIATNVGFAISIDQVLPMLEVLRDKADGGAHEDGYLGVGLEERVDGGRGAVVTDVDPASPASSAGIRTDDIVVAIDGTTIDGTGAVIGAIRDREPGDEVQVQVQRDGETKTFSVILVERPPDNG